MTSDRLIRAATAAVVTAVAAFAAVVSYSHVFDLGRLHGQSGTAARLLPLSVDGLIVAASLVLLHEARNGRPAPALARCMLWLGVSATLAANALYGLAWGVLGVALSAWPGAAFVGSVELLMGMVRRTRSAAPVPGTPVPEPPSGLNGHGHAAADLFAAELARGEVPGIRRIRREMHLGQPRAQQVREYLAGLAGSNGHDAADAGR
jgi:hypothetical protein